jgi:GSCFA family
MAEWNEIDGATAWANLLGTRPSRWNDGHDPGDPRSAHARIARGIALPEVTPKFRLRDDDVYFCIGSCFARNIEEHLIYRRLPVISRSVPFGNRTGRPNGAVNKYTAASVLNELRWSLGEAAFPENSLVEDGGAWRDLHLAARAPAAPLAAVLERRAQVRDYFARVREATVMIVTLGLVETWYDAHAQVMLNAAPTRAMTHRFPGRFRLVVTDYAENVRMLREIIDLLSAHARDPVRVVVSVSPVPMSETFTGRDVIVANAYSKATLRAAADDAVRPYANADYYPSYEAITVSHRRLTYNAGDDLHVLDSAVRAVAAHFLEAYGAGGETPDQEFVELDYLWANPDVHDAVVQARIASGYEHWLAYGRAEGRPLRAPDRPVAVQRLVGP